MVENGKPNGIPWRALTGVLAVLTSVVLGLSAYLFQSLVSRIAVLEVSNAERSERLVRLETDLGTLNRLASTDSIATRGERISRIESDLTALERRIEAIEAELHHK